MDELNFICPFMRISLNTACKAGSCPYYTTATLSHCVWAYINSKNTITPTELAIILGKHPQDVENTLRQIKIKLAQSKLKQYLQTHSYPLRYCHKCGRTFNLKEKSNEYVCASHCKKSNPYEHIERVYQKPISHILLVFASFINLNMIAELLQLSNKNVKDLFIQVFGDASLLSKFKDSKEVTFKKRTKKLKLRALGSVPESISFNTLARQAKKF